MHLGCLLLAIWALAGFFMEGQDELTRPIPLIVVLGGGVAGERLELACELFSQGHGRDGVVLTGGNQESYIRDRAAFLTDCGVPKALISQWTNTANSFEEMRAVRDALLNHPNTDAIVVSNALHMPRLRYLRERFGLNGRVILQQRRLSWRPELDYSLLVLIFWFREPLAYCYYRFKY